MPLTVPPPERICPAGMRATRRLVPVMRPLSARVAPAFTWRPFAPMGVSVAVVTARVPSSTVTLPVTEGGSEA